MIIKDAEQLRDVPVGTEVLYVQKIKVVETSKKAPFPCNGCVFYWTACQGCEACCRPDGKEVKFIKV